MTLSSTQRAQTIQKIIATKQRIIDGINADMDRLDDQLQTFDDKVASGATLTATETAQRQTVSDSLDTLQANAQRIQLLTLQSLDDSAAVAALSSQIDQANQELTQVKQQIDQLTTTLTNLGNFLTSVTSLLTSLTGLLAALA